jgi:DNA adenine methylase
LLNNIEISVEQWETQKEIYRSQRNAALQGADFDVFKLGFATFYLNRTNRSGILKGGIIGGREQVGNFTINARFNKQSLAQRIHKIGLFAKQIELHNEDAKQFLLAHHSVWSDNTLVYCDPPYVKKGKGLYMNYFTEEDHKSLAEAIAGINGLKWVITYDVDPLISEIYQLYRMQKIALSYSAHTHASNVEEFIIFSDYLMVPDYLQLV